MQIFIDIQDDLFEHYRNFRVNYEVIADRKNALINECVEFGGCPLQPLPPKIEAKRFISNGKEYEIPLSETEKGYNTCIDEILREE